MDIDKLIDSVNPQNNRERKKLYKALSQIHMRDYNGHRYIAVPKSLLGVIHEGYWYYMYCYDTIYDDIHFVYIGVKSPDEVEALYDKIGVDTYTYFSGSCNNWCYPHFRKNESDYLWLCTNEMSTTPEEYMQLLLENNDILA